MGAAAITTTNSEQDGRRGGISPSSRRGLHFTEGLSSGGVDKRPSAARVFVCTAINTNKTTTLPRTTNTMGNDGPNKSGLANIKS